MRATATCPRRRLGNRRVAEQARIRVSRAGYQKYFSRAGVGKLWLELNKIGV